MELQNIVRNARKRSRRMLERQEEAALRRENRNRLDRERRQSQSINDRQNRLNHRRMGERERTASEIIQITDLNVPEHNCGTLSETCNFCQALYWKLELNSSNKFTNCCHDGKVILPPLSETPDLIKDLLCENSLEAKNYREHIRQYNAAFSFASMGAEIKLPSGAGPYCFRIHGQIYHRISPLYTDDNRNPGYGQLYIFDCSEATNYRMETNRGCLRNVMEKLDALLRNINPFAESYSQMHELVNQNLTMNVKMIFMEHPDLDLRRYNAPASSTDVAAIFVGDDGEPPVNRDICIYPKDDSLKNISPMNQCCDPMTYPLLFLAGERGWHSGLEHVEERRSAKRVRVTQLQYYAYRLSVRSGFSILHSSGKLFQQYIVDSYVKTEGSRLNFIRNNQNSLRVYLYSGLLDALRSNSENNNLRTGKLIILPSTFLGSARYMQQNYQDAMAIVRKFGRPDLFITFTCNPAWPEILDAIERPQRPENRPDIVVRVFKMKLSELLDDILKRNIFGVVIAYVYVIEFQKRGLPHAHILLTLDSNFKIRTKDDIDKYVSAELPNIDINPRLFEIVTKCMIHGPCGTINPNSPCMKEATGCSKLFPKEVRQMTEENINGYPEYRRRSIDPVKIGSYDIDNRWVVPYNPWLLKKFNAHINVEVCASVKSVKYLYKYVYKGHDAASIKLQKDDVLNHDEILTFLDGRYVSAPEALWRLNEFSMSEKSHSVFRLAVHLPEQQQIFFQEGREEQAVARASTKYTHLTAWFHLNSVDEEARNYVYPDIPNYYVFDKETTMWTKRKRGGDKVIGRLPAVSIQDSERYYLRMLLLHRPGATNFNVLKTVNGIEYETFHLACKHLGFLEGDEHWHETLSDAARIRMPSYLRVLFCIICGFGEVQNIPDLWEQHKIALCEDFVHRYSEETAVQYALADISDLLKAYGLTLEKLKLPQITLPTDHLFPSSFDVLAEQNKARINSEKLNASQKFVVDTVLNAIYTNQGTGSKCFFLDGPAGTGKTFVYETLLHIIRGNSHHATPVASTGIAATLLAGGRTAHSVFKIPLNLTATSTCSLNLNSTEAKLLKKTKLILWDEAPMTHVHAFLAVDRLLQDLTKCPEPFGGKVVLLGGDFRQVLPVILRGSRSLTVASCLKKHRFWSTFQVMKLTENMRALENERDFANWLLDVGEGKSGDKVSLPAICYPSVQDPLKQLYHDIDFTTVTPEQLKTRAILTVTNDLSLQINHRVLHCLPSTEVIYNSVDSIVSDDPQDKLTYPEEFLNSLTPTGMPPHALKIKQGAIIMLLRNLVPSKRLCNGTRLIVTNLQKNIIEAKHIDGNNNETFLIPRIYMTPSDVTMPFKFKRKQFPVRLSFSMTINKSQGQTFDKICLDLSKPVFSHGQLYVGLSRVRSFDSITVISPTADIFNCTYNEVF